MDVNIGETPAGRLKMELFSDIVPKYVYICVLIMFAVEYGITYYFGSSFDGEYVECTHCALCLSCLEEYMQAPQSPLVDLL